MAEKVDQGWNVPTYSDEWFERRNARIIEAIERFTDRKLAEGPDACSAYITALMDGEGDSLHPRGVV